MMSAKRHVPLRMCISCGAKGSKREFTRIVSTPEEGVKVDRMGKLSGRGAYVCGDGECSPAGLSRGRIEQALKRQVTDAEWNAVTAELAGYEIERI